MGKMFGLGNKRPVPRPKPDPGLLLAASDRRKPERGKFADGNQVENCCKFLLIFNYFYPTVLR